MAATGNSQMQQSINEIHGILGELRQATGRVEGQLGTFIGQMKVQDDRTTEHDARIRKVENGQHKVGSIYGLAGGLLSFIGIKIFGGH